MKYLLKFLICFVMAMSVVVSGIFVMAYQVADTVEVIFQEDSIFTEEEKDSIIHHFVSGDQPLPYGLICTLFGHDYKSEITHVIKHRVFTTAPRCIDEVYDTQICTRCGDTQAVLLSENSIYCCP